MTCLNRSIERECSTLDNDIPGIIEESDIMRMVRLLLRWRLLKCMWIKCHEGCWKEGRNEGTCPITCGDAAQDSMQIFVVLIQVTVYSSFRSGSI
jgi:hypothetical protein